MQQTPVELPVNKGISITLPSTGTTSASNPTYPAHQHLNKIHTNPVEQLKSSPSTSTTDTEIKHTTPSPPTLDQPAILKDIVGPLVNEVRDLKDSVQAEYSKLEGIITNQQLTINKLEATITTKQRETSLELTNQISCNTEKLNTCLVENKILKKENEDLKECLTQIELAQLGNNMIISGMQEQPWETNDTTKEKVIDTIVAAMGGEDKEAAQLEARKIDITCCSRTGRYQLGRPRPISVTFQRKEDKKRLLENKQNLPTGVYINEEYQPILRKTETYYAHHLS